MEWISVKDYLPDQKTTSEDERMVLTYGLDFGVHPAFYDHKASAWNVDGWLGLIITYWMPLPKIPNLNLNPHMCSRERSPILIDVCHEEDNGKLIFRTRDYTCGNEHCREVNYCPYCGFEAKNQDMGQIATSR